MLTLKLHPEFEDWLSRIKDKTTLQRLNIRLRKLSLGHVGDTKAVGGGVFEMREHFGPGWRLYFCRRGQTVVVMLAGGDKGSQAADIARAIRLAALLEI